MSKKPLTIKQWEKLGECQIQEILQVLDSKGRVEVRIVGAAPMIRLNWRWRRKNKVTDVLSFPSPEIFRKSHGFLGELVVCLPVLKKQAKEFTHTPEDELRVLLVHGILHLLGMDHEKSKKEAREMARAEAKVLCTLGALAGGLIQR